MERIDIILQRLEQRFDSNDFEVINESDQHIGHAGHQGGNRHFAIRIKKSAMEGLSRVAAHREIYALFDDMMPDQIHALRIELY